jgi:glutamate synthase (NADPH/NADH)
LPQRDFAQLLRDATDGLPVAGRKAAWEAGRPTVVHGLTAQKPRGFITYEREPLPYRPVEERLTDWKEVHAHVSGVCVWCVCVVGGGDVRQVVVGV